MRQVFQDVVAGAREAVQDMIEPERWTVTLFVAPRNEGYRLLVRFETERLNTAIPGSIEAQPSPRVAARNWVGSYLAAVARVRGVPGRRPIDHDEQDGTGAASGTPAGRSAGGRWWRWGVAPFSLT